MAFNSSRLTGEIAMSARLFELHSMNFFDQIPMWHFLARRWNS